MVIVSNKKALQKEEFVFKLIELVITTNRAYKSKKFA